MAKSQLIAFCSIDVIGSTAFKTQKDRSEASEQAWFQFFQEFHEDMRVRIESAGGWEFWKSAGDELLFTSEVLQKEDMVHLVNVLKAAIDRHNEGFQKQEKEKHLAVKGAIWIAGFPVVNAVIKSKNPDIKPDYLGPSIDAGFRICKFASATRIAISVEAAYLLSSAVVSDQWNEMQGIRYGGETELKGVFGGNPYPMLWIPLKDPFEEAAFKLTGKPERLDRDDFIVYCKAAIKKVNNELACHLPYIVGESGQPTFGNIPDLHSVRKQSIDKKEAMQEAASIGESGNNTDGQDIPNDDLQTKITKSMP
ncbi:hypothetical protein [Leptonema illini]|uniref:Guanylate cyclase domain-containing protein n=1 Tax=Leptonema illini DSM 21528 TaxID=929563 RepID=H2CL77_9LEPT|nr:hypothetical protein [Leptonema illini]EHQ08328.1 hypothetical protein Lepil_3671 [Leptonema illini DSM 21528]